jgi:hypothetical protein
MAGPAMGGASTNLKSRPSYYRRGKVPSPRISARLSHRPPTNRTNKAMMMTPIKTLLPSM